MRVTIWDLDYYYAKEKVNCFNPDVMKISSFHKQSGDRINFVEKIDDIYRPYDLYYVIKDLMKSKALFIGEYGNKLIDYLGRRNSYGI